MQALFALLTQETLHAAAFTGISGVGKSTILRALLPEATIRTGEVRARTGQGRQTTSQTVGHLFQRAATAPALLFDLPGVQQFGVCHLTESEVHAGFPELERLRSQCKFSDCSHHAEPACAVREAVLQGALAASRYRSYLDMIKEIRAAARY